MATHVTPRKAPAKSLALLWAIGGVAAAAALTAWLVAHPMANPNAMFPSVATSVPMRMTLPTTLNVITTGPILNLLPISAEEVPDESLAKHVKLHARIQARTGAS